MLAARARTGEPRLEPPLAKNTTEIETLLELGQGGMATAYLGRTLGTAGFERLVVLKRLNNELLGHRDAVQRFLSEARVAARLHHVNVVGTHQIGWDTTGPFIVLDYVEGGSLSDLVDAALAADELLPVGVVLRIALDVLAGLSAVHEASDADGRPLAILHRDVSLENVLVGVSDGVARVSDFGVAKSALGRSLTDPGCFVGKVLYFAPEYLLHEPVGPALDLYALGVTLWLALTGDELWPNASDGELARAIVHQGVPSLEGRREVAPEIREFLSRAAARDVRARFQSAREMMASLQAFEKRTGAVASHAEVAACVERLLGARLQERRDTVARLVPELAGAKVGDEPLELRETVRDSSQVRGAAPAPPRAEEPARARPARPFARFLAPLGLLAFGGLLVSLLSRSPERAPGPARIVAGETPIAAPARAVASASELAARTAVSPAATPDYAAEAPLVVPTASNLGQRSTPAAAMHRRTPSPKPPVSAALASTGEASPASDIARKNPYR